MMMSAVFAVFFRDHVSLDAGRWLRCMFVLAVIALAFGCAPKQVRVYDGTAVPGIRDEIIQHAVYVIGKPYKSGAKGPEAFDCSGLIHYVYKRVNIVLPVMTEGQINAGLEVPRDSALPGDLVFFKINNKELHAGVVLNKRDFIHSSKSRGVTVDSLDSNYWRRSLVCFRSVL